MNPVRHTEERWLQLKTAGLLPSVTNIADYTQKTTLGLAAAQLAADELLQDGSPPDPLLVRELHLVAFADVVPFAGRFRQDNGVMIGGYNGADANRISHEIALAAAQYRSLLASDDSPAGRAAALAFHHIRLMRVHPFTDGNGRCGRTILTAQANALFGQDAGERLMEAIAADTGSYFKSLQAANRLDLGPLSALIGLAAGIATPARISSPFRVAPVFRADYEAASLDEDLQATRSQFDNNLI